MKRILRLLEHVPVGAFNAWVLGFNPIIGAIFFVAFIVYELNEDWSIKDQAWQDLAGWLWGAAIIALLIGLNITVWRQP